MLLGDKYAQRAHRTHTDTEVNAHWNRTWSFAFQMKLYITWGIIIAKRMKRMHLHAYSNSSWSIIMSWWTNGYSRFRILPMGVQSNVHRYNWHMHLSKSCCRVLSLLCLLCARNVRTAHTRSPCTLDNWSPFVSVFMRTTDEKKVNSVNIFELRTVFANSNYGSPFKPCASAIERCDFEILSRLFCFGGIELILTTNCLLILIQSPAFACDVNVNIGLTITCLRLFWDWTWT